MSTLAFIGGSPKLPSPLEEYKSIGEDEINAVNEVMKSGNLSGFYGSWEEGFLGGKNIQEFENAWSNLFGIKHSISVNSNTSGLYAAMGAIGVGPGDEIIVPATSMSATAMCPLIYGGVPVFADLDKETFCMSVQSVQDNITDKTKAVIVTNLFGHPASLKELRILCDQNKLYLIEDNAQAIWGKENNRFCGTIGDIGVFSLNYHKHIHTGEGGVCVTNDSELAQRMQMIRNHAEAVVEPAGVKNLVNMVGFNYRMTEMTAAIGLVQLKKIETHMFKRVRIAKILNERLKNLDGISLPIPKKNCQHAYYSWVIKYNSEIVGIPRDLFVKALQAEGFECFHSYVKPLYLLPLFQSRTAIGNNHFPFNLSTRKYDKGLCPTAETLYEKEIIGFECCAWNIDEKKAHLLADAFLKVFNNRDKLMNIN